MNIIFKHTMKNIFCKPVRTFVVTFSIFLCALCAMLCFDLLDELQSQFNQLFAATFGNADILLYNPVDLPPEAPNHASLGVSSEMTYFYKDLDGEYNYVHGQSVSIYSFNFDAASVMGVYDQYVPEDDEVVLSSRFARDFGYEVGDTIELQDNTDNYHEMTVAAILPGDNNSLFASGYSILMNGNSLTEFANGTVVMPTLSFIDVLDASQIDDMIDVIEDVSPGATYENVANNEEFNEMMEQATSVCFLIFAIAILLVVFVTISICDKIISERMSVVGTLRSLGLSNRRTAFILLLENVIYALMGSLPALIVYSLIRTPIMSGMFATTNSYGETVETQVHPISIVLIIAVIAGCILAECLLPLKAVISATRTPIRDIIFDNRDTAYVLKKRSVITGCVFLAASVVLAFFHDNMFCIVGFVVTTVVALALLTPILIIGVSKGLQKIFANAGNMPCELSAREMRARKSTVGSAVLCATSAAICVTILAFGLDMVDSFSIPEYNCNAIVDVMYDADTLSYIDNLEGVNDIEYAYMNYMSLMVNGEDDDVSTVRGMPDGGFRMVIQYSGLPERLEPGTVAIRKEYAKKHHLSVGDTLCLTIDPDGIFPLDQEFEIVCLYEATGGYKSDNVFIIGLEDFTDLYGDDPSEIYLQCDDPDSVIATIKKYSSMNTGYYTMTVDEYLAETAGETDPVVTGLIVLIAIGVGMTFIGTASNQIIGFEGRKRECAVMLSTSMNKKQLSGVLFREVLFASFVSSVAGCIFGMVLIKAILAAFDGMGSPLAGGLNPVPILIFTVILAVVFTLTVLFPIGHLRKMQLSEQLKYE